MTQISKYEMFALLALYQLGTTVIFGFASESGRDAWLASGLSAVLGACLVLVYLFIFKATGGLTLVEWFPWVFGKWFGTPLAWLFPLLFIYNAARIISDVRFLFPVTILNRTPDWIIGITFLGVVVYALLGGVEVVARLAGFFLPLVYISLLLEIILLAASNTFHFANLLPVAGEGWGRILKTVWPLGLMQTYGESIEFAVIWGYVREKKGLALWAAGGTLLAGFSIALMDLLVVSGMGEAVFQQMMYPAFALLKLSNINYLDNLDAIGIIYLVVNAFIKMSMHLFTAAVCLRDLTGGKSEKPMIVVASAMALFISLTMVISFTEHLEVAKKVIPYNVWVPMFLALPGIVLLALPVKKWIMGVKSS
ncbi:GerAB/ArcD/ProY family transporter [Fontibacillus sp. BL9]|uniref:GerAB/ArcD/ProY family transporter n=1 Tax=Fontibacillus sp. BL9 TaxID=3389971 RepID=UPI00397B94DE